VRTELVAIPTDTVPLDSAYYTPDTEAPRGGVLLMHGNTMNFYVGPSRFLPPALTALGYACLAFNRRGDQEPEDTYPASGFQQRAAGPCEVAIIPDCDHFYVGKENVVTSTVCEWLRRLYPP
jgi:hypothetical protein